MTDFIIKDIEELIKLNRGDLQRLNRIKNDFEKTKIITLPDRKYVESLASRYLKEEEKPKKKRDFMKSFEELSFRKPRVPEPTKDSLRQQTKEFTIPQVEQIKIAETKKSETKPTLSQHQSSIFSKQNAERLIEFRPSKKIMLIAASVIVAIIAIGVVATQLDFDEFAIPTSTAPKTQMPPPGLSVVTDQLSYNKGDIISISGTSETSAGNEIKLFIENQEGKLIWSEVVKLKSSGVFSTLIIAAGAGWDNDGEYTLRAEHGSLTNQVKFDFDA